MPSSYWCLGNKGPPDPWDVAALLVEGKQVLPFDQYLPFLDQMLIRVAVAFGYIHDCWTHNR
jgi:hypothetical protein